MTKKRLGVLTGGGDCPGLNAVIRAIYRTATYSDWEVIGIRDSFTGMFERPIRWVQLDESNTRGLLHKGGTILGTRNTGSPFSDPKIGEDAQTRIRRLTVEAYKELKLDALIVIGGDGTQTLAYDLLDTDMNIVGLPKTIDNDLAASDQTIGFDTAVAIAADAISRLHSTAESHERIMILEVMGRDSGYIALHAGLAGGANVILIPEIPFHYDAIVKKTKERIQTGQYFSLVVIAEGAVPRGGEATMQKTVSGAQVLGGISQTVARELHAATGLDARVTVLGHIQRGGPPIATDCVLASRFGVAAFDLVKQGKFGKVVTMKGNQIGCVDFIEVVHKRRPVSLDDHLIHTAEAIGTCLGR